MSATGMVVLGIALILLSLLVLGRLVPREGKPLSVWTKTDVRAIAVAIALMILMTCGAGVMTNGILGWAK